MSSPQRCRRWWRGSGDSNRARRQPAAFHHCRRDLEVIGAPARLRSSTATAAVVPPVRSLIEQQSRTSYGPFGSRAQASRSHALGVPCYYRSSPHWRHRAECAVVDAGLDAAAGSAAMTTDSEGSADQSTADLGVSDRAASHRSDRRAGDRCRSPLRRRAATGAHGRLLAAETDRAWRQTTPQPLRMWAAMSPMR
jgi:hypothetical protein